MNHKKLVDGYNIREKEECKLRDAGISIGNTRKSLGLTQEALGYLTGMGKAQVCKIEKGGNPTVETLEKVFNALDIKAMLRLEVDIKDKRYVIDDYVLCVFEFSKMNSITPKQAFNYLKRFGGMDYYLLHHKVILTLPLQDTMEDLKIVCRNNGGQI